LERIKPTTRYCLLSTRVTSYLPGSKNKIADAPLAYLLGPDELNNDPSNFWIFTPEGLKKLLTRVGWKILDFRTFDNNKNSVPNSLQNGQRAFCLLENPNAVCA